MCLNSSWLLRSLKFGYKEQDFNYSDTVGSLGDTLGGKFSIRKAKSSTGYEREKKLFCLSTSEIVCNYANVKFVKWPHEPAANRKFSCSQSENGFFFTFLYRNVALYYVSHDFGRSVRYSETKKQGKCRAGGHESVRISVIARVRDDGSLFQSFLYAFRRGGWLLSAVAECP